ncbi:transposase [Xenorhabdus innexi]|uniref:Transposase n=1 Tax=Xenorhabdus innexi TaxID=290109 RepID=A0A2G0NTK5_9GAMM|nr:transposase [Xenorhabdus innexi]
MGYSLDFRKRVLAYKNKHALTFEQTSDHFEVSGFNIPLQFEA